MIDYSSIGQSIVPDLVSTIRVDIIQSIHGAEAGNPIKYEIVRAMSDYKRFYSNLAEYQV
jgi:hypothetical protein